MLLRGKGGRLPSGNGQPCEIRMVLSLCTEPTFLMDGRFTGFGTDNLPPAAVRVAPPVGLCEKISDDL